MIPPAQLADQLPPVSVCQAQVQDRHVQAPVDERLPGFGERASLDYHPEVGLVAKVDVMAFRLFTEVRGR